MGGISQRETAFDEPLKPDHWMSIPLKRGTGSGPLFETREFYLPRQREQVSAVVDCYFDQLNPHRPVFMHEDFVTALDALYDTLEEGKPISPKYVDIASDSGFLCSVYLVLALGTLCVETQRLHNAQDAHRPTWPGHEDFYDLALALKPDLTNSISTLQALILLHWYLYTEVNRFSIHFFLRSRSTYHSLQRSIPSRSVTASRFGASWETLFDLPSNSDCTTIRKSRPTSSRLKSAISACASGAFASSMTAVPRSSSVVHLEFKEQISIHQRRRGISGIDLRFPSISSSAGNSLKSKPRS